MEALNYLNDQKDQFSVIWGKGGLICLVTVMFFAMCVCSSLRRVFDPLYFWHWWARENLKEEIIKKRCLKTQKQANEIFRLPQIRVSFQYAQVTQMMLFTMFF